MDESDDRLSKLPDSLIFLILSFLPMRDVVFTTILSKRWNNLWTTIPYLNFSEYIPPFDCDEAKWVRNFVNQALMFWKGVKILKFSISIVFFDFDSSFNADVDSWVRFAVENKVEELNILTGGLLSEVYKIPQCLKLCSSIRKLSLTGLNINIVGPLAWNQLKSLKIVGDCFYECQLDQILSGMPRLEVFELHVLARNENFNIRSISLKKLKMKMYTYIFDPPSKDKVLGIYCPNLEALEISGMFYKCLFRDVSYLTDATLGFHNQRDDRENELIGETLREILPTIQLVEKLTLSPWCVEVLCDFQKKHLPSPLPNVKILGLYVDDVIEPDGMMNLLGIFPNLKMLIVIEENNIFNKIAQNLYELDDGASEDNAEFTSFGGNVSKSLGKGEVHETIHSKSFLKTIEITSKLSEDTSVFRLIEFLLKHATMLENIVVRAKGSCHVKMHICLKLNRYCEACQDPPQLLRCFSRQNDPRQLSSKGKPSFFWERWT